VIIQFAMFRGGAVSEAAVLDSKETPHELDPVAAVQLLNEIPELQRVDQIDAISSTGLPTMRVLPTALCVPPLPPSSHPSGALSWCATPRHRGVRGPPARRGGARPRGTRPLAVIRAARDPFAFTGRTEKSLRRGARRRGRRQAGMILA